MAPMKTEKCTDSLGAPEPQNHLRQGELFSYPPQDLVSIRTISRKDFRFLVVRAIQRSGVSYRAQRRACDVIKHFLPETYEADLDHQARELAARCLRDTKPVYGRPAKRPGRRHRVRERPMPAPADQPPPITERPLPDSRPMKGPVTLGRGPLKRTYTDFSDLLAAVFAWEDEVKRLRDCEKLNFKQIARRLYLAGAYRARTLYARARRRALSSPT